MPKNNFTPLNIPCCAGHSCSFIFKNIFKTASILTINFIFLSCSSGSFYVSPDYKNKIFKNAALGVNNFYFAIDILDEEKVVGNFSDAFSIDTNNISIEADTPQSKFLKSFKAFFPAGIIEYSSIEKVVFIETGINNLPEFESHKITNSDLKFKPTFNRFYNDVEFILFMDTLNVEIINTPMNTPIITPMITPMEPGMSGLNVKISSNFAIWDIEQEKIVSYGFAENSVKIASIENFYDFAIRMFASEIFFRKAPFISARKFLD